MNRKKTWGYVGPKRMKPKVPDSVKAKLTEQVEDLIENVIKPKHIKPPPPAQDFNYLADVYAKWYRNYFYFCATYNSPGPNAIAPSFETKFARMDYAGDNKFNLAYMRHTGQWWEIYQNVSMQACLKSITEDPHFIP